jgi:hypothetical protein
MRKLLVAAIITLAVVLLWPEPTVRAGGPCAAPKSWGRVLGVTFQTGIINVPLVLMEAEDGHLRVVHGSSCKIVNELTRSSD